MIRISGMRGVLPLKNPTQSFVSAGGSMLDERWAQRTRGVKVDGAGEG